MQKIKSFFKKRKDVFQNLLYTALIMCCATLVACMIEIYTRYQQKKLQYCMYLFPKNTVEQCELIISFF